MRFLIQLIIIGIWIGGVILYSSREQENARKSNEKYEKEIRDLSIPPTLNKRVEDSNWTIAYWISADKKDGDCITADEYMDRNAISKTVTRRGHSKTYYLADYVESCRNRIQRAIDQAEPPARKWCAYRHTNPRLEKLCEEWEHNKDRYIAQMRALDEPTLTRYSKFISE